MTGTAGYYKRQSGYYFSIDEYTDEDVSLTDLFSFSIKVDKAGQTLAMPEGENIFTLTEERFDELIHSIDYKGIDASLWIALEKKIHLSSDKLPIMNYTVALANKGAIKDLFAAYRKKNASSNIEKIYYYDEFCGVYILCEYNDRSGYSTKFYCFPGELLEGYHEVKIVNNSFVVHDNELIEKKEATCYESGYSIVKCKVCGLEQKINVTAPYYHFTYKEYFHANYYYDVGRSTEAKIEYCERCDMILQFSFNPSLPYGYEISFVADGRVNPGYNIKHLILPEFAYSHFDLSNLRLVSDKCPEIVSIRVPQGREVIATGDFVSATGLQVLWLPGSITEIEDGSFYADDDLHTIFFEGTEDEWQKINLNGYATLWSDVEIIFVPDGVDSETVMAKCTE